MGRRLALLIATYEYQDTALRRLTAPAHDADALAEVLRDPDIAGFEVTTLINQPHHRVGEAIGDFYRDRRRDDLTLLYFTGHGLKDDDGRLYLAMANTRRDSLIFTALAAEQVDQAMESCVSRQKVLILDCCYSGAYPAGRIAKGDDQVHTLERFQGRGRTMLTASDATQYSFEGGEPHGAAARSVFTRYLVAGLRDGSADLDGDGDITVDELYSYVHDRVVEELPQQRPKKQDSVQGRVIIARNVNWALPSYLRNAIGSPIAADRLGAVEGLAHLHRIGNDTVRATAMEHLRTLADDDSRAVSAAAADRLTMLTPTPTPAPPAPPSSPSIPTPPPTPPLEPAVLPDPADDPAVAGPAAAELATPEPTSAVPESPSPAARRPPVQPATRPSTPSPAGADAGIREWTPQERAGRDAAVTQVVEMMLRWSRARARAAERWATWGPVGSGVAALVAGVLFVAGQQPERLRDGLGGEFWPSLRWYLLGMALIAAASGVALLVPRTRSLIGPGVALGGAAAATWGVVLLAPQLRSGHDPARWSAFLGHAALLLAAAVAGAAAHRGGAGIRPRRPRWVRGWMALGLGSLAAATSALTLCAIVYQISRLTIAYGGTQQGDELGYRATAYVAAITASVLVPLCAALAVPAAFARALLGGWLGGATVIAVSTYLWVRDSGAADARYAAGFGAALLVLAATAVLRSTATSSQPAPKRRRVLLAGLVAVAVTAAAGAVVVNRVGLARGSSTTEVYELALSPDGSRLYVAHSLYVSIVDTANWTVVNEYPIPVGSFIAGLAVSRDGGRVYAASEDGVTVIDTATHEKVGSPISVASEPDGLAISPDGARLYVTASGANTVTSVTSQPGGRTNVIPVGTFPTKIAMRPDGQRAYVANTNGGSVSVIDTRTDTTVGSAIELGGSPSTLAVSPDGQRLYVAYREKDTFSVYLAVIDTVTQRIDERIPVYYSSYTLTVSPDSKRVYVIAGNELAVIDGGAITKRIPVGPAPAALAVGPDGRRMYVGHSSRGGVWRVDLATGETIGRPILVERPT